MPKDRRSANGSAVDRGEPSISNRRIEESDDERGAMIPEDGIPLENYMNLASAVVKLALDDVSSVRFRHAALMWWQYDFPKSMWRSFMGDINGTMLRNMIRERLRQAPRYSVNQYSKKKFKLKKVS